MIRAARPADLSALVALETAAFSTDRLSRRSLRRLMDRPSAAFLVADGAAGPLGYAILLFRTTSPGARLYSIARAHDAPPGTGGRLLAAVETAARGRGCTGLRLEVREDNNSALRLYEREGYRVTGSRPAYYEDGATALLMRKPL